LPGTESLLDRSADEKAKPFHRRHEPLPEVPPNERYVLATGDAGAYRLRIVNSVHGPDTEAFLLRAGLVRGMKVADIGCGIGTISCWMADRVGSNGSVTGIDVSAAQVEQARKNAADAGLVNTQFCEASAYDTGLEQGTFDLVFSRFVLMHLARPQEALVEMAGLLRPGGVLAVEDGDFTRPYAEPPSAAYDRCFDLYRAAVEMRGADPRIGPKLYRMVRDCGFAQLQVTLAQPVFVRGDAKRLPEWTLEECAPALLEAGLTTRQEIDALTGELKEQAAEESTLFAMAQMTQVWARK
jgi:SAM-dependent methyltransferase